MYFFLFGGGRKTQLQHLTKQRQQNRVIFIVGWYMTDWEIFKKKKKKKITLANQSLTFPPTSASRLFVYFSDFFFPHLHFMFTHPQGYVFFFTGEKPPFTLEVAPISHCCCLLLAPKLNWGGERRMEEHKIETARRKNKVYITQRSAFLKKRGWKAPTHISNPIHPKPYFQDIFEFGFWSSPTGKGIPDVNF